MEEDPFWLGITLDVVREMGPQDQRRLNNLKKAILQCDEAMQQGRYEDDSLAALCRGIEVAQKLRRSLLGCPEDQLHRNSKRHFLEFLRMLIPHEVAATFPKDPSLPLPPAHPTIADAAYEVRCKAVHENETLNAAEHSDHHILIDWELLPPHLGRTVGDTHYFSGVILMQRLRAALAPFVTFMDSVQKGGFSVSLFPALGSIRPD